MKTPSLSAHLVYLHREGSKMKSVQHILACASIALPASITLSQSSAEWTGNGTDPLWSNPSNWSLIFNGSTTPHLDSNIFFIPDIFGTEETTIVEYDLFAGVFESITVRSSNINPRDQNVIINGQPGSSMQTLIEGFMLDYSDPTSSGFSMNVELNDMDISSRIRVINEEAYHRTTLTLDNTRWFINAGNFNMPGILRITNSSVLTSPDSNMDLEFTNNGQLEITNLSRIELPVTSPFFTKVEDTGLFYNQFNSTGDVDIASGFLILNTLESQAVTSTISGHISGPGGLVTRGNHTLRLIGANSFSGNIWIQGGALEAESGPALGPLARTMIFDNNGIFRPRATFNALMTMQFNGAGTIDTSLTQDPHLLREPWNGAGDFTKAGTGVLILDHDATAYTGQFIVDAGTLQISNPNVFTNQSQVTINQNANLLLNTPAVTIEALRGNGTITGNTTSLTLIGNNTNPFPEFSGQILANPTIIKDTSSVQMISSDLSAFTGSWQINGSNLMLTGPNTWNGNTNIAAGSTLIIEGGGTFNDELIGGGSILHRGNNTLTFNPSNTGYQGRISVRDGATLDLQSSFIGRVKVNDEGTLTGNNASLTEIEAESGGTISPGADQAAGILTTQSLLLAPNSMLNIDIIDASSNDHIIALDSTINAQLSISLGAGFTPALEDSYSIITSTTSLTGTFANLDPTTNRVLTTGEEGSFVVNVDPVSGTVTLNQYLAGPLGQCSPADLNADGFLDFFDISTFLTRFSQQDTSVDYNNDSQFDFFDISAFLTIFSNGCP